MKDVILRGSLLIAFLFSSLFVVAQLSIPDNTTQTIDFTGFDASGFVPSPAAGQLDSDTWSITGFSFGDLAFGGTQTSDDYARGSSSGGVGTGGIYAFDIGSGDIALGVQPGGSDFTPGELILRIQNNTGGTVSQIQVDFDIYEFNDQGKANSFNFSYSDDNISYTNVPSLDFTSTETAGASAWLVNNRTTTLTGFTLTDGDFFYLKWTGDEVSGSGSMDEFALDNVAITVTSPSGSDAAGEIMFVGFNSDGNKGFSFVTLVDIENNYTISFTDDDWNGASFDNSEGFANWTNSSGGTINAGTVVTISNISSETVSIGTFDVASGTLNPTNSNENLFAYIGVEASPTFLAGIGNNSLANTGSTLTGTGLTSGTDYVEITSPQDRDVMIYEGITENTSFLGFASSELIGNSDNWAFDDGSGDQSQDASYPDFPDDIISQLTISNPGGINGNLILWLDGSREVYNSSSVLASDGNEVEMWDDLDAKNNNASQTTSANRPIYQTDDANSINFNAIIDFSPGGSGDDFMNLIDESVPASSTNYSIFIISSPDDANTASYLLSAGEPGINQGGGFGFSSNAISHDFSGNTFSAGTAADNEVILSTFTYSHSSTTRTIFKSGNSVGTENNQSKNFDTDGNHIGSDNSGTGSFYDGKIAEIIIYDDDLSSTNQNQVESYLALKYGITLDQTSATDYVASDGTTEIWDKDAAGASTYDNDIAGIGRDDGSDLGQVQSKSQNSDAIVTIVAESEGTNAAPSFTDIADLEFLTWGNDDGSNAWTATGAPALYQILTRQWSVQEVGDVGTVTISFDVADGGFNVLNLIAGDSYLLLIDSDNDGSLSDETPTSLYDDGTNGDDTADDNVWTAQNIDFTTGQEFTLATSTVGPGGLTTSLGLWFKADAGTSSTTDGDAISQWNDQSGDLNHASEATNQPDFRNNSTNNINGNPVMDFNGSNDLLTGVDGFYSDEFFIVLNPDNALDDGLAAEYPIGFDAGAVVDSDQSGLLLGITPDGTLSNEIVTYYVGSSQYRSAHTDASLSYLNPVLINTAENSGSQEIRINNELLDDETNGTFDATYSNEPFTIGARHDATNFYNGKIAEFISFSNPQTATNRQFIESYLAIKYGLTMTIDNNGDATTLEAPNADGINEGDYVATDGSVIWDASANSTYHNEIAGIGRDDDTGLSQLSSTTVNSTTEIRIANGDASSPTALPADLSYLLWGHDNAANTFGSGNLTNADGSTSNRMTRVWAADETGTVGDVEIVLPNSLATGTVSIVFHPSDATFPADALRRVVEMVDNSTDYEGTIDLADGFISFVNASASAITNKPVVINEVIADPQQDWGASGFFDVAPGGSGTQGSDEWVELYISQAGLDLTAWTIELNDGTDLSGSLSVGGAFNTSNYLSLTGGSFTDTDAGDYLILGNVNGGDMDETGTITINLTNGSTTVDQVILDGGSNAPSANASATFDESIARIPNGNDTNINADDFFQTRATLGSTNSPTGTAVINEVITSPQQDWGTNNFDGTVTGTSVDAEHEWVEIYISSDGINLTGWTIELTDGTNVTGDLTASGAFENSVYTAAGGGTFIDTRIGDYLVLGDVTGSDEMDDDVLVVLRDSEGTLIDQVQLGGAASQAPSGASTGINDEAVARYPNATDTDTDDSDFIQTRATMGSTNSPVGAVVINEIVTDPQQDWSTNQFNGTNGGETVDTDDEWIELYIVDAGINLTQWTIDLGGTSASLTTSDFAFAVYSGSGTFENTAAGDFLVLGNPPVDLADNVTLQLLDASGNTVDQTNVGTTGGDANDESDESVSRIPNGTDTDNDAADFQKTPVSMGANNSQTPLTAIGNALDFDGTDDYVEIADDNALDITSNLTLEAWVNLTSTPGGDAGVISKYETTNDRSYGLYIDNSGQPQFSVSNDGSVVVSTSNTTSLPTSEWHHIAAVYTPNTSITLYIDGVLVDENTTSIPASLFVGTAPLWIAAHEDETMANNLLNGLVDEARIWDESRTQEEILENMNTTVDPDVGVNPNLVVYYRFDRASGTTLADVKAVVDGTLNNMDDTDWVTASWDVFAQNAAELATAGDAATSGQLTIADVAFLNDAQDLLLTGHDAIDFSEIQTDLPAGTLVTNRYGRSWHMQKNDAAGTADGDVTFTFDIGATPADQQTYYLLERTGVSGAFSIVPVIGVESSGTSITFTVSTAEIDDDSYYTLGRSDDGPGNALNFDDTNSDHVSLGDIIDDAGLTGLTLEAWVRPTAFPPGNLPTDMRSIIAKGDIRLATGAFGIFMIGNTGAQDLTFAVDNGTTKEVVNLAISGNISLNTWQHVALGWTAGGSVNAYVNGVLVGSSAALSGTVDNIAEDLVIGGSTSIEEDYFEGTIDEVRIWDVERTQDEIVSNFYQNILLTDADLSNLVGYYRFNQGIGNNLTNLPDHSGDDGNGSLTNFTNLGEDLNTETSNYVNVTDNAVTPALNRNSFYDNVVIINPEGGATDILTNASDELTLTSTLANYLIDEGDFVAWGNDDGDFSTEVATNLPTGTLVTQRRSKNWFFTKNDEVGTANGDITFSFDLGAVPDPDFTYYLLTTDDLTMNFSIAEVIGVVPNGNSIEFTVDGSQITNENYYTLGRSGTGQGNALDFDGSDDMVVVQDDNSLDLTSTATWEFWVNVDDITDFHIMLDKRTSSTVNDAFTIGFNLGGIIGSNFGIEVTGTSGASIDRDLFTDNTWHHVAITYDKDATDNFEFYLDGISQPLETQSDRDLDLDNSSEELIIGKGNNGAGATMSGMLDEVRIWSDVRTQNEIQQNMHRTLDVTDANNDNLAAYYRFNQGIGDSNDNLPDLSGNNNNGALTNFANLSNSTTSSNWVASEAVVSDQTFAIGLIGPGNALDFDGTNDVVSITHVAGLTIGGNPYTVEAWINAPDADQTGSIVAKRQTGFPFGMMMLSVNDGSDPATLPAGKKITMSYGTFGTLGPYRFVSTVDDIIDGNYHHVACVVDPTEETVVIYVDGILQEVNITAPGIFPTVPNTEPYTIGSGNTAYFYDGIVDEVRIWHVARTAAQIQDNMFKELVGDETFLIAYYKFDELDDDASTTLPDQVGSNDGTLTNMPSPSDNWVSAAAREPFKTTNTGNFEDDTTWKTRAEPDATSAILDIAHDITLSTGTLDSDMININSGSTLTIVSGQTITVDNDIINNGTVNGAGALVFDGAGANLDVVITGGTFSNIDLEDAGVSTGETLQITLQGNTTITGDLDLNADSNLDAGNIVLDDFNLTVNNLSNFSSSHYIETLDQNTSGGFLIMNINQADGQVTYPVYTDGSYTPASMINLGSAGNISVRAFGGTYENGTSGTLHTGNEEVDRSWEITSNDAVNITLTLQFNASDQLASFDPTIAFMSKNDGGALGWQPQTPATDISASDPRTISKSGISTFSTFGVGSGSSPLPVELTAFSATPDQGIVHLDWQTATEINNEFFEVQHSINGEDFEIIGKVAGNGTTNIEQNYAFIDSRPVEGINYYRLRQVDFDGAFEYSPLRMARVELAAEQLMTAYPNPLKDVVTIEFARPVPAYSEIQISGIAGHIISRVQVETELHTLNLNLSALPTGIYLLQVKSGSEIFVERLVKE
ncbi:MAG: LamG-like jellyroll fold domain-containing protein [Cyclobacteriaceae bacterium]